MEDERDETIAKGDEMEEKFKEAKKKVEWSNNGHFRFISILYIVCKFSFFLPLLLIWIITYVSLSKLLFCPFQQLASDEAASSAHRNLEKLIKKVQRSEVILTNISVALITVEAIAKSIVTMLMLKKQSSWSGYFAFFTLVFSYIQKLYKNDGWICVRRITALSISVVFS